VARAEAWLLSCADALQPWDRVDWVLPSTPEIDVILAPLRAKADPLYPAPIAILDCVQYGLPQTFEGAIRSEMAIFAHLIQRPEARNMIQTLFLGKTDYDRLKRRDALPAFVSNVVAAVQAVAGDRGDPVVLCAISEAVLPWREKHTSDELRLADYAVVKETGYPSYLGGPFSFAVRGFD
jgi:3-hydroxyacyl-CoA dehydrogenase/enoyl-CoA hydratase/3-hydroxybutyryl-CoA epimerase